tara:strand:- start:513 stop:1001 length:489 start_codon:yes stop_codon:yes gene_type:complete
MTEEERKNFLRKAKTRKRLGLKPGTSEGPAGMSGDPKKKLKTLREILGELPKGTSPGTSGSLMRIFDELQEQFPNKRINRDDIMRAFRKKQGRPKPMLEEEVDIPDVPVKKGATGPNMGQVAGGFKTVNVKKGGLMKAKKKKAKKSKVAGRLAKRGYGAARR